MKHHETLEHSLFNAMISALDAETSALGSAASALGVALSRSCGVSGKSGTEFLAISVIAVLV